MVSFDPVLFRQLFPLLQQKVYGHDLIYFDNAATTQKFSTTINAVNHYYLNHNANVHRASHYLSAQATTAFEGARAKVQGVINAKNPQEIIWTKGTTEAINLVAQTWGLASIKSGDEIVLSHSEHHANIVPWQHLAKQTGALIKVLPLDKTGRIDLEQAQQLIGSKTRLLCCAHISNVIGKINPVKELIQLAKKVGAVTLIDGAQAIAHQLVDVQDLDCDFYVFSAHKFYGPTGLGVLYGKEVLLTQMPPYQFGGEMIKKVSFSGTTYNDLPFKFEPGTPNISGVIGFAETISSFNRISFSTMQAYERSLIDYMYQALSNIAEVEFVVAGKPDVAIFSFNVKGIHQQDLASYLDAQGIAVRVGHHCAMPLMEYLGIAGCIRASLAPYNTFNEIDRLITAINSFICLPQEEQIIECPAMLKPAEVKIINIENIENTENTENTENIAINEIIETFAKAKQWDVRHREIMLYGKKLSRMAKIARNDNDLINGCESAAWLTYEIDQQGRLNFSADSDAKIIRGLLYIVIAVYQGQSPKQVSSFDIHGYFEKLGLSQHLSPSRNNGLLAIVQKIQSIVTEYLV